MEIEALVREVNFTKNYDMQSYRVRIDAEFYVEEKDVRRMQVFDSVGSGMNIKLVVPTKFPNMKEESYTIGSTKGKVHLEWPDYAELGRKAKRMPRMLRLVEGMK